MKFIKLIPILCLLVGSTPTGAQEVYNISDPRLSVRLPDAAGDTLSLSSFKGKVVLLDFWASWCMPCRSANRKLVKLYSRYKDQGFEIFGVSLDESKKDWLKAVARDKINWVQVNENGSNWEAATAVRWNVTAIPMSFLINKKGDIVAWNTEPAELDKLLPALLAE